MKQVPTAELDQLTRGEYGQPHTVLGPHPDGDGVTFRVYKPLARTVTVVTSDGTRVPLEHEHEGSGSGRPRRWTSAEAAEANDVPDYRVEVDYGEGAITSTTPTGSCRRSARWTCTWSTRAATSCCGPCSAHGSTTTAPRPATSPARRSRSGRRARAAYGSRATSTAGTAASTRCGSSASPASGSCSCPASARAPATSTSILGADGEWREKADPMAFWAEVPPATSSRVFESTYEWGDDAWMRPRGREAAGRRADVGLRGAPRLVAASGTGTC